MIDGVTKERQKIPMTFSEQHRTEKELNPFHNNNSILDKLDPCFLNGILHAELTFKS